MLMRKDLERRLRRIEMRGAPADRIEFWIDQGDGILRGPRGEQITREQAYALGQKVDALTIVIDEMDQRL